MFVVLPFPGVIHVLRCPSTVSFRSDTRSPCIILATGFIGFLRCTGIIYVSRILRVARTERGFLRAIGPFYGPDFFLCIGRFR